MKNTNALEAYIKNKLEELDQQKDMTDINLRGKISFGVDPETYGHLPAWKDLLQKKKRLGKWIWIDALILSIFIVGVVSNIWEEFQENWIHAVVKLVALSAVVMLFFLISGYYTMFARYRQAEREVRKLIYQDILDQLEKEEIA